MYVLWNMCVTLCVIGGALKMYCLEFDCACVLKSNKTIVLNSWSVSLMIEPRHSRLMSEEGIELIEDIKELVINTRSKTKNVRTVLCKSKSTIQLVVLARL